MQQLEAPESPIVVIGKAIFFASLQFSVVNMEIASKFFIKNSISDQDTLNHAARALNTYLIVGSTVTVVFSIIFGYLFGVVGLIASLVANGSIILWIVFSYRDALRVAADKHGLTLPGVFG